MLFQEKSGKQFSILKTLIDATMLFQEKSGKYNNYKNKRRFPCWRKQRTGGHGPA
jgi:hypothetical protein